jgi:hypothetical protein
MAPTKEELTHFMQWNQNFLIFTSFVSPFGETTEEAIRKENQKVQEQT